MKKIALVISTILLIVFCYGIKINSDLKEIGVSKCIALFKVNGIAYTKELSILRQVVAKISNNDSSVIRAKDQLAACRNSYKKIEFFAEYFFSSRIKIFNQAPVYEVEEPFMEYQHPTGMQAMEQILFGDSVAAEKNELMAQAELMFTTADNFAGYLYSLKINDSDILDAVRLEIIRIYTLGITGYDAPEFKTGIREASFALAALQENMEPYLKACDQDLSESIKENFGSCIKYLTSAKDFNSFNRLDFFTSHALPLQEKINGLINHLNLQKNENKMLNYAAKNIFSSGFINKTGLPDSVITTEIVQLGKTLFNETELSGNNTRSCATCHKPDKYFSDGEITSVAFNGENRLLRNAPSLLYAVYQHNQFLDGRAKDLASQMLEVITSPKEMNANPVTIINKLKKNNVYRQLFTKAFPASPADSLITIEKIGIAISGYEQSFNVMTSPFDKYMAGDKKALTKGQQQGFNLFMGKAMCATCHFAPVFNGLLPPLYEISEVESLGLTKNTDFKNPVADTDSGRYRYFGIPFYIGAFKTSTVRNAAVTAPYMHNGAFATLQEVIDFYNKGGGNGMGLHNQYQTLSDKPLHLTRKEIKRIISFLNALTDQPVQ